MKKNKYMVLAVFIIIVILALVKTYNKATTPTPTLNIAVAGNFSSTMKKLANAFEEKHGYKPVLAFASTGKHYAQIKNGAPFDLFFAADIKRPQLLEDEDFAIKDSRFTYAIGQPVLWSPDTSYIDSIGDVLHKMEYRHLAIATPELAPYGYAAKEVLEHIEIWDSINDRIVQGENINQTFQFVQSGNAELGFIAFSQICHGADTMDGSWWDLPDSLYTPIEQQAVVLSDNPKVKDFLKFIKSDEATSIIRSYGYRLP